MAGNSDGASFLFTNKLSVAKETPLEEVMANKPDDAINIAMPETKLFKETDPQRVRSALALLRQARVDHPQYRDDELLLYLLVTYDAAGNAPTPWLSQLPDAAAVKTAMEAAGGVRQRREGQGPQRRWQWPAGGEFNITKSATKSGMQRITFEDFQRRVEQADVAKPLRKTDTRQTRTRVGCYWSITKGISVSTWFVGTATDEGDAFIVERVD